VSSLPDPLLQPSIPLTGDSRADADIIAFYKARQKLIKKGNTLCSDETSTSQSSDSLTMRIMLTSDVRQ